MAKTTRKTKTEIVRDDSYFDKVSQEVQSNQSRLSMILGGLIILVVVILLFNYFNRNQSQLGPSQQTEEQLAGDVSVENLPGKYTVKEGDTLFLIAQKYYNDGYKYTEIVKTNSLANADQIEIGQALEIPKLEGVTTMRPTPSESPSESASPNPAESPEVRQTPTGAVPGSKGAPDATMTNESWGAPITGDSYTVVSGDWLSTIAARAYNGDVMAYQKLAQANNIQNPDLIEPGMVIKIPR